MGMGLVVPYLVDVRRIASHVIEEIVDRDVRAFAPFDASAQIDPGLDELEHREVEIGAQSIALVGAVRARIAVADVEQPLLVEVVQHDVVTGRLRTAAERDVAVNHIARIAQHLVIPIDIRRGTVPVGFECGGIVGG